MRLPAYLVAIGIAAGCALPAAAQVEIAPFGGYRFGGSLEVPDEDGTAYQLDGNYGLIFHF